jgi:hypothetical protein
MDFVSENVGSFANGSFPRNGNFISVGALRIYVGTAPTRRFPTMVHVELDPPTLYAARGLRFDRTASNVKVMMDGADGTGKGATGTKDVPTKSGRTAKMSLERQQNNAETSNVPPTPTLLQASVDKLATSVAPDADVVATQAELEAQCQNLLRGDYEVVRRPADNEHHPT